MKQVLLVIHTNTYFTGMFPLGKLLKRAKQFEPVFFFCRSYPTMYDDLENCRKQGLPFLLSLFSQDVKETQTRAAEGVSEPLKAYAKRRLPAPLQSAIRRLLRWELSVTSDNVFQHARRLFRQIRAVRQVIRVQDIALLVLPADNRYDQSAYVKAAHLEKIGVVVIPQFMAGPLEWAEFVWDQPAYQGSIFLNLLAGLLYPRWVLHYKGRKLVSLPGAQIIAREWLGIAPPLPWVLHSGYADMLAVESDAVRDYGVSEGLPLQKLNVTGSVALDILADGVANANQRRLELCYTLGLPSNLPIILSALPPDSIYMGRPDCEFKIYAELVEFWCRSLAAIAEFNIIICLHPSVKYEDMKYIEDWGLKIMQEPTVNLIPLCDIFVASISATIQWAIACGKPVVNYDVYHYRYTDYADVGGVILVEEKNEFQQVLCQLASSPIYYTEIAVRQSACAERWGRLDGKAGERLLQLFDAMVNRYSGVKKLGR